MTIINYFDGTKIIKVEVNEQVAAAYKEIQREEWRQKKQIQRYETHISEISGDTWQVDFSNDPLYQIVQREEEIEKENQIKEKLDSFTFEQKRIIRLLKRGISVSNISRILCVAQSSVWEMRERIQKKLKIFFKNTL